MLQTTLVWAQPQIPQKAASGASTWPSWVWLLRACPPHTGLFLRSSLLSPLNSWAFQERIPTLVPHLQHRILPNFHLPSCEVTKTLSLSLATPSTPVLVLMSSLLGNERVQEWPEKQYIVGHYACTPLGSSSKGHVDENVTCGRKKHPHTWEGHCRI